MGIDICVQIGRRIRHLRTSRAIYQVDLAEKASITRSNLSLIENGHAEAGIRTLYAIAKALDVTLIELLDGVK